MMTRDVTCLPPEVLRRMWQSMPPAAQVAFLSTCRSLYSTHSLDMLSARLREFARSEQPAILALQPRRTLVRRRVEYDKYPGNASNDDTNDGSDAIMETGSSRYKKLVREEWVIEPRRSRYHDLSVLFVVVSASLSPARDDIELRVAFPEYRENSADSADVRPDGPNVVLSDSFKAKMRQAGSDGTTFVHGPFSYNDALKTGCVFAVVKSSNALRRWWMYGCAECKGSRFVCPGCPGVHERWGEAFSSCGFEVPCPMCVGYGAAIEAKAFVGAGNQRAIDENLNVAQVLITHWSKKEWSTQTRSAKSPP